MVYTGKLALAADSLPREIEARGNRIVKHGCYVTMCFCIEWFSSVTGRRRHLIVV